MIKRYLAILTAIFLILMLSGCGEEKATETIHSVKTEETVGSYSMFRTEDPQKYLEFLENFDEEKYEIVDISTSMYTANYGSGEFYIVTYKVIK